MSYILDALKKAEAERNQGAVPGVHAQQSYAEAPARPAVWRTPWPWISLTALAAVGAALVLQSRPPAVLPAQPAAALPPVAAATPAAVPASPPTPSLLPKDPPPRPEPAAPRPKKESAAPRTAEKSADKPADKSATARPVVAAAKPVPDSKPSADTLATPAARIPSLRELPQEIQSQIPALSITGYLYAEDKANRTVLINQRLLREGDQVAPELRIEQLTPSGMVLNFRGHRYRTTYR